MDKTKTIKALNEASIETLMNISTVGFRYVINDGYITNYANEEGRNADECRNS